MNCHSGREGGLWSRVCPGNHTWSRMGRAGNAAGQDHVGSAARGPCTIRKGLLLPQEQKTAVKKKTISLLIPLSCSVGNLTFWQVLYMGFYNPKYKMPSAWRSIAACLFPAKVCIPVER